MPAKKTDAKKWKRKPGGWGRLRMLPSGNLQASFKGPDGVVYKCEHTFHPDDERRAENWLLDQRDTIRAAELAREQWKPPTQRAKENMTVSELVDLVGRQYGNQKGFHEANTPPPPRPACTERQFPRFRFDGK